MSPEQCEGLGIDHRTDIYALGVLLYEMVAARVPHDADTAIAILHKHVYERPTPIDLYVPDIPASLKRIIGRCLDKKPERRYQSMHELQADLARVKRGEGGRPFGLLGSWANLIPNRRRLSGIGLAVAIVATLGVLLGGSFSKNRAQPLASSEGTQQTVKETERGVPDALARPKEETAEPSLDPVIPPESLARPKQPPGPKAARHVRKSVRKKPSKRAKPVQQADEVLDPWM
jgi:hypothetical protein